MEGFANMDSDSLYKRSSKRTICLLVWGVVATIICIGLTIGVIVIKNRDATETPITPITWCAVSSAELLKCQDMSLTFTASGFSPQIKCIQEANTEACIEAMKNDNTVVITLDGGHIYNYREFVQPVLAEDYGNGDATYWAVAVVRKNDTTTSFSRNGLQGKKTCHTGYGKTAGWIMPIGKMMEMDILVTGDSCNVDSAASNVFGSMCVPGATDAKLTELCPTCNTCQDSCLYCGYSGAFRCMVSQGDVAFVKHTTVFDNTDGNNQASWAKDLASTDYELLCEDGTRNPVTNYENCNLGKVPSHAVMISKDASIDFERKVEELLFMAQLRYGQGTSNSFQMFDDGEDADLLFKSSTQFLQPLTETCTTPEYLGDAFLNANLAINCLNTQNIDDSTKNSCLRSNLQASNNEKNILRWCVISDAEHQKCRQMAAVAQNMGEVLTITCVQAPTTLECGRYVSVGSADVVSMDGGEIYNAGVAYNLQPITAENYGDGSDPVSYYAIAVIKESDSDTKFTKSGLQGKKTCHTGYQRTSGWNVPIGLIIEQDYITVDATNCDDSILTSVANFFGGSCVPGVPSTSTSVDGKLCELCTGVGDEKCTSNDPFSGYSGAFDCLKTGGGDIAFIKHATVNTTVGSDDYTNYRLLCRNGEIQTVDNYLDCNLEKVPSHALMMSATHSPSFRTKVVNLLKNMESDPSFDLFSSSGGNDLLFKDSTQCLSEIDPTCTWEDFLSSDYMDIIKGLSCNLDTSRPTNQCMYTPCTPPQ